MSNKGSKRGTAVATDGGIIDTSEELTLELTTMMTLLVEKLLSVTIVYDGDNDGDNHAIHNNHVQLSTAAATTT